MALLLEVLGVLAIAAALNGLGGRAVPTVPAVLTIAVVVLGVAFWGNLWSDTKTFIDDHNLNAKLTREEANTQGGGSMPDTYPAFADSAIPKHARVFAECAPHQGRCSFQEWLTFRLTPRVFVEHPSQAQWAIFFGVDPSLEPFTRGWRIIRDGPAFAVAQAP